MISYMVLMGVRGSTIGSHYVLCHYLSTMKTNRSFLSKILNVNESKIEYICMKYPVIQKLEPKRITFLLQTLRQLGFSKKVLLEEPQLFSILPVTLKNRYSVLNECGINKITATHILTYLKIIKMKTVGELKQTNIIPSFLNIENRLANYMTQWPTALTSSIYGDVNKMTLYNLRLNIIQRYLELILDLSEVEFYRGIKTYPTIKHRPLHAINETFNLLQSVIMISNQKLKNNMYLIHTDPDNLKEIIYDFRSIGGIDIKEILRMRPKLATKSITSLMETRKILEEYGISNEAQKRCFDIYTLGPETVRERLEQAKQIPEFNTFFSHPRFLKMIHYKNTAMKRMRLLYSNNKKCLSLNILSGSTAHYEVYEKAPGDRLGKGKDLIFCISESLGNSYTMSDIRKKLRRHPFWINIPLVQVKYVYQKLSIEFSNTHIYENCAILLYPWNKIKNNLNLLDSNDRGKKGQVHEYLNLSKLNKSQKLSLVLYLLEKNHYFTGNGVWTEEKNKITNDIADISSHCENKLEYYS
ncbi:unnamed protein product [Diatraea saccharalis]|uniref:Transcription termination factor 5, mitochondrial n=1 Tax=Diatraea saccharalis TaxID=40085 RepID=A0A9N9QTK2_9NEOP|nr:unnamed protein product [Diatraea saccharalis]